MTSSGWPGLIPTVLVAAALILVPGLLGTAAMRIGIVARIALSGLAGVASIGLAGVLFSLAGVAFASWQPIMIGAALGAAGVVVQRALPQARPRRATVPLWVLALVWALASVLIAVVAFAAVPDPGRVSQTYDNVFHISAIAHILETGDASSLTLRTMIETDRSWAPYPAAWHSIVALVVQISGVGIPAAANAAWVAVGAALWLPGLAWLTQTAVPRVDRGIAALIALPLGTAFAAMPYALLTWGTLYPTFLATAVLPAAVAVVVAALGSSPGESGRARIPVWVGVAGTCLGIAAIAVAQSRVLVTWAVLLAPLVIFTVVRAFRSAHATGGARRRRARRWLVAGVAGVALTAAVGFAYVVVVLGFFERPLETRLGGPQAQATQSFIAGIVQVVLQAMPTGVGGIVTTAAVPLAAAVAVGLVLATRDPQSRWIVVSYGVVAVLFALAAGSDEILSKLLTAAWYKDRYRLASALPVLAVPLASWAVVWAAGRFAGAHPRLVRARAVAIAGLIALTSAVALISGGVTASTATTFRMPEAAARTAVVSQAQIEFLTRLPDLVPPDQRVLGDPWDGSAWSLAFGGRAPVFPHVNGQWDSDRQTLAWHLQNIETDPSVCAALDALRVRHVLYDPHEFGGGDPAGNHFPGPHAAVLAGLFTLVATDGVTDLYRIDQCGPLG